MSDCKKGYVVDNFLVFGSTECVDQTLHITLSVILICFCMLSTTMLLNALRTVKKVVRGVLHLYTAGATGMTTLFFLQFAYLIDDSNFYSVELNWTLFMFTIMCVVAGLALRTIVFAELAARAQKSKGSNEVVAELKQFIKRLLIAYYIPAFTCGVLPWAFSKSPDTQTILSRVAVGFMGLGTSLVVWKNIQVTKKLLELMQFTCDMQMKMLVKKSGTANNTPIPSPHGTPATTPRAKSDGQNFSFALEKQQKIKKLQSNITILRGSLKSSAITIVICVAWLVFTATGIPILVAHIHNFCGIAAMLGAFKFLREFKKMSDNNGGTTGMTRTPTVTTMQSQRSTYITQLNEINHLSPNIRLDMPSPEERNDSLQHPPEVKVDIPGQIPDPSVPDQEEEKQEENIQ